MLRSPGKYCTLACCKGNNRVIIPYLSVISRCTSNGSASGSTNNCSDHPVNPEVSIAVVPSTKSLWDSLTGFWITAENNLFDKHKFLILTHFVLLLLVKAKLIFLLQRINKDTFYIISSYLRCYFSLCRICL